MVYLNLINWLNYYYQVEDNVKIRRWKLVGTRFLFIKRQKPFPAAVIRVNLYRKLRFLYVMEVDCSYTYAAIPEYGFTKPLTILKKESEEGISTFVYNFATIDDFFMSYVLYYSRDKQFCFSMYIPASDRFGIHRKKIVVLDDSEVKVLDASKYIKKIFDNLTYVTENKNLKMSLKII